MCKARTKSSSKADSTYELKGLNKLAHSRRGTKPIGIRKLKILFAFCFVTTYLCDDVEGVIRPQFGIKELKTALNAAPPPFLGHCDFEKTCDWSWNKTSGFRRVLATEATPFGPDTDASQLPNGHYLWLTGHGQGQIWSKMIPKTARMCILELALHQVQMQNGQINIVIETSNHTSVIIAERPGNDNAKWEMNRFNLGANSQYFRIVIEITAPLPNSSIAVDDIRLSECFPESRPLGATCTDDMFRCNNGSCLNKTRICDLTPDCAYGEDEQLECDEVPENARCNFEDGWCGWNNDPSRPLKWTRQRGPTPNERTGPSYDHTYRNASGSYMYVNMSGKTEYGYGAVMASPVYNPTPPYSSNETNPYYKSCQARFFYHQYGPHSSGLGLYLVRIIQQQNVSEKLWWKFGDQSDVWYNQAVVLPEVKHRYFFRFEAIRGMGPKSDVAIDDFSLSPECFGIGVPQEFAGGFNYSNYVPPETYPEKHTNFTNETTIKITTCGAAGRFGPTPRDCAEIHNGTGLKLLHSSTVSSNITPNEKVVLSYMSGIQRWTVPEGKFYTIIAMGAGGGRGSGQMGSTLGATVRAVVELEKGQHLYFLIGEAGIDACPKNLGLKAHSCQNEDHGSIVTGSASNSAIRQVKNIKLKDSGGGGGGATYVFTVKSNGEQKPLLIAAGGGGLGHGQFVDNGIQHGQGPVPKGKMPESGLSISGSAGSGGGWNGSANNVPSTAGTALIYGGVGGTACKNNSEGRGDGGFGGGGGGCLGGGGGGGYIGGSAGHEMSSNGEGGYSFAAPELSHISYTVGGNSGPGKVFIVPAISGCGCDFRCVVIDEHLSETRCLCPSGWLLGNDTRSCVMDGDSDTAHQTFMILLIAVSIGLLFAFSGLCLLLYNRYQHRKALLRRRQVMFGNGTELTSLRAVSDNMMTEFNPNYEFAGNLYSFKDLPQIPRDNISLVKPLGQGAFGEVFQGVYKYNRSEEHPVAVKTLPSLSTSQAEADFMMEALIMSKFNHPNIVHFIGVSFDNHPRYIVLELLAGGDLKNFLREERPRPDRPTTLMMQDLVMCAYDVANGCKYMEDARFIHRDIAARNCLLTSKGSGRIVKIADFGMARDIYRSDYYRKGGKAMLPIKWMPPESFLDGIFTTKTDVWAFGVLLWEIMSFGYMPYTGCANREVMSMVTTGGRLERPAGCPDPIYGVMTQCWHPHPEDRPSFSTIVERIGYCLQDPDVIDHPMPNYDILPACEREITIMRPDPETECINVRSSLDGCGYMQPRANFRPVSYRIGPAPGIVYASLQRCDDCENEFGKIQETALSEPKTHQINCQESNDEPASIYVYGNKEPCRHKYVPKEESNTNNAVTIDTENPTRQEVAANCNSKVSNGKSHRENGNYESTTTTDTNSDSLAIPSTNPPPETSLSSPNTRMSSPNHTVINANVNNNNGVLRKSALKAALSLDPSALCRGTIPYEKIAFSPPPARMSNPGSIELRKDSLGHELPREEECSC
ncbi:ALK tyrosine kinase receptor isoform X2 [Athalia rosae]|uniref:ALK tyrosine kinase receptor isoform X2 n=1 Tax=Athalia rosae TaxID=37344 RepID=UPI0020338494|nr:ALK tyrosine kinase receptor isoform X2 [Athalia rosae]